MTYREGMQLGEKILNMAKVLDPKNDAWLLLSMACKIDNTFYYTHLDEDMTVEQVNEYQVLLKKRSERIPLQYITGEQDFYGLTFHVNSNVLIPRQDTETLVEQALKRIEPGMRILDMCTGSGCVLISILKNAKDATGIGIDISKQALNVAKENARLNGVQALFERSDLFDNVIGKYDMIVSNPPYIRSDVIPTLMPEVSEFEPQIALDGDEDGLIFYRKIVDKADKYLNTDGMLLFEIGNDQGEDVRELMMDKGFTDVTVIKDLARNDRVVYGRISRSVE